MMQLDLDQPPGQQPGGRERSRIPEAHREPPGVIGQLAADNAQGHRRGGHVGREFLRAQAGGVLDGGRPLLLAGVGGVALAGLVIEETIRHVQRRTAYDHALAKLQTVRHRIVELSADVEMAKRFAYSVSESFRDGRVEAKEICMIKFQVPDIVQRVVEGCLQLHGGYGFLDESWVSRVYRDIRFLSVGAGTSELMKDLVAAYLRL